MQLEKNKKNIPKLRFHGFDKQWKNGTLGDYYKNLRTGMTPSRLKPQYFSGSIPWITSGELNYGIIEFTNEKITEEAVKDTKLRVYPKNTFFMAITGLEAPGTRGKCAINAVPATTNQSCLAFEETPYIYTLFLFQWYKKEGIRLYYEFAQGTKQQSFNNKLVKDFIFNIPTLPEQQKIASFLTTVDEKTQQLSRKKELLEEYKKGVMQQLFSGKLRFKDENGEDYPDWENTKLGDLITLMQSGISRMLSDTDIGLPIIRSNNLQNGKIDITDIKYWFKIDNQGANLENYVLSEGDLLVNFINSIAQIGKVAIFSNLLNRKTIFTTNLLRLRFNDKTTSHFMINCFYSKKYENFIQSITKPAVSQASFTTKDFRTFTVNLPSRPEQQKIADFLSNIDLKLENTSQQINQMKNFKKGLLQQMFV